MAFWSRPVAVVSDCGKSSFSSCTGSLSSCVDAEALIRRFGLERKVVALFLGGLERRKNLRRSPCFMVFSNLTIDFNAKVMPCCNLQSDHLQHEPFGLGDPSDNWQSMFDIYANRQFTGYRRSLATVGEKQSPSSIWKQKALGGPALVEIGRAIEHRLRQIGVQV